MPLDGPVETHPSYGQIGVSRVTGATHLYGSDFTHRSSMILRIHRSERRRDLSHDYYFSTRLPVVEVEMSESQWARLLSSPNVGGGVPCTIRSIEGERVPNPPAPKPKTELFDAELAEHFDSAISALEELKQRVVAGKGGKDSLRLIDRAVMQIRENSEYVARQFGKHMEETIDKAKEEVNAYAMATLAPLGLGNGAEPPPALRLEEPVE